MQLWQNSNRLLKLESFLDSKVEPKRDKPLVFTDLVTLRNECVPEHKLRNECVPDHKLCIECVPEHKLR